VPYANAMLETSMVLGVEKPEEIMQRRYWDILEGYSIDLVIGALKKAQGTESFFPKPSKIIELIGQIQEERNREQPKDKYLEWERDRRLHPEEYFTEEEIPG